MDNYDEMYKCICRLCLSHSKPENMLSLFDEKNTDGLSCYGKSVISFANIVLKTNDNLPTAMCKSCLLLLKQAIRFKFLCEYSAIRLKNLFEISNTANGDLKENVCQYALFNNHFPDINSRKTNNNTAKINPKQVSINPKLAERKFRCSTKKENYKIHQSRINNKRQNNNDAIYDVFNSVDSDSETNVLKPTLNSKESTTKSQKQPKERKLTNLTCPLCQKVLANKLTYNCHMQRHNGCRYICESCGKGFPVFNELNIHKVTRHGTGQYVECNHCQYKAPCKFKLIEHLRLHTGERPFTCEKCGLTFRRRAIWKKHLVHHSEKTFQCQQCPKKFYRLSSLKEHMNNVHDRLYMFSCTKCGCLYAKTRTVRRHLLEKHGIPRELQGKILRVMKGGNNDFGAK
ncbi:zinc finger protein 37 homolog [Bombyx mandarina]|uniref:Zinc finger protein 37 homolog n=1 Tax=Bombyx mandarina TaxID=7092 RepID=A0A6J2KJA5_BOMMA|nr:zinc finger protein 37 homolog [Bombyx mandarina]